MPVDAKHKDYTRMVGKWTRCRDVADGQDAVHERGEAYLPKLQEQQPAEYAAYVKRTPLYNATWRTIVGLMGMVFRQPPKVEAPDALKEMLDDVTMSGVPLQLFAQEVVEEALKVGRLGVLTDYPSADVSAMTQADAQAQNLRPMLQIYRAECIINWKTGRVKNATVLTMVVLEEEREVPIDEWSSRCEKVYRVLDLVPAAAEEGGQGGWKYRVRLLQVRDGKDVEVEPESYPLMNSRPLDYIPFTFISTDDTTPAVDEPPLVDLVNVNLSHYRTSADLEHGAHFTGLPTPWVAGYKSDDPSEKMYIGSTEILTFSNPDAKAEYLEFTGQGLGVLERLKAEKEKQMAVLGARMLEPQKAAVETAESAGIHRKGEESTLSMTAQTVSLGLRRSLQWFASWAAADPKSVEFELNRDFFPAPMSPQQLTALIGAWQAGGISDETLFDNLKQGEVIGEEVEFEDEQTRIEQSGPKLLGQTIDPKTGLPTYAPPALPGKKPGAPPEPGKPPPFGKKAAPGAKPAKKPS